VTSTALLADGCCFNPRSSVASSGMCSTFMRAFHHDDIEIWHAAAVRSRRWVILHLASAHYCHGNGHRVVHRLAFPIKCAHVLRVLLCSWVGVSRAPFARCGSPYDCHPLSQPPPCTGTLNCVQLVCCTISTTALKAPTAKHSIEGFCVQHAAHIF
jgi:hypothetical protein